MFNLTTSEKTRLTKIRKRVRAGELIVLKSDKGNRFTVSSVESYERQGDQHTMKDRNITEEEQENSQARMNVLSQSLSKIVGLSSNWGTNNEGRCWANLTTGACISPLLYPSPKMHKEPDAHRDPKTRPIV